MTDGGINQGADAVALHAEDDVATVLRPIAAGERIRVTTPEGWREATARRAIPMCHKLALASRPAGAEIRKYGAVIGRLTAAVEEGDHVHVHNLKSRRALALEGGQDGGA